MDILSMVAMMILWKSQSWNAKETIDIFDESLDKTHAMDFCNHLRRQLRIIHKVHGLRMGRRRNMFAS